LLVEAEKSSKPRKAKKTEAEIIADLEQTGISFTRKGLGPWSHSKLKMLKNCPLQFYLKYILKRPASADQPISLITEVGKAAHRIIELNLGGKKLEQAYRLTREEFRATITDEQWAENLETVEYNLIRFKERIDDFEKQHGIKRIFQELRIGCTENWEPTGFFADDVYYRGVIDLIIQLDNNDIVVLDHKFGTSAAMGLRNFQDQLNVYKVLYHKGVAPIEGATCGIHHIREGEIVLDDYVDKDTIENSLLNRMEFSIQGAIDTLLELGYFKHVAGNACKYCDYRDDCKAGKLKDLEKGTKKWFEIKKID
jgi:hypothetical protein